MAADNRLTVDQLAALSVGDTVTIESSHEFDRPRYAAGTVIRVGMTHVDVSCDGVKGATTSASGFVTGFARARAGRSLFRPMPATAPPEASQAARPST